MILGIAAAGQVAEDPALPLAGQPRLRPPQAELRLADARRPGQDRQRAREQSTSQRTVQFFHSKRMSSNGHSSLAPSAAAGAASSSRPKQLHCEAATSGRDKSAARRLSSPR